MNRFITPIFRRMFRDVVPVAVFSFLPLLSAQQVTSKPQRLSSPDQVPEGLSRSDWTSIRAAYEAGQHAFQPIEGGWQARNPGQQWTTNFDRRGFVVEPKGGGWRWGLDLKSYGFDTEQHTIGGMPAVKAEGPLLTYQWDDSVQEWFVNDTRGLEHGFTIAKRPESAPASQDSTLDFVLTTQGDLRPSVTADAQGIQFQDKAGATVLNYTGLKVWDADGRILRSYFEAVGMTDVRLRVEEAGARYPLTIDPIAQQAYIKASNTGIDDEFGCSVAVSGDTVVVGARYEDSSTTGVNSTPNDSSTDTGAAYVFVRNGTTWTQQAYLKASNPGVGDYFGSSVAVSGETVVVGAYGEDSSTTGVNSIPNDGDANSGAAYVFVRNGTTWSQQAYLKASNTGFDDEFGISVAVSGDTVVVGADREDSNTTGVNSTPNDGANNSGATYVFVRSGTVWSQQAYLKASNTGANDQLGISVAVSGDTVVVGANQEDSSTTGVNSIPDEGGSDSGAGYVFVRSGSTWTQQAYLKAGNTGTSDWFGYSVAVSGDTVVVGTPLEDSSTMGVNSTPNESATNAGSAFVFVRSGTTWSQQAYLKSGNSGDSDLFGFSVAVSGDVVVVGAYGESSSTTGVNSTPNENAYFSGAAYVFVRNGMTWGQQAYLKAGNPGEIDSFGRSVAVSGDTVVVGALYEDSSTTGVNSTPNDGDTNTGASYIFTGFGPSASMAPTVQSPTSSDLTLTGATLGGNVTDPGSDTVTERGIVYSWTATNADPDIGGTGVTKVIVSGTTGVFTTAVTGLASGTNYTFKAYAINSVGTAYSTAGFFTTPGPDISIEQPVGTVLAAGGSTINYNPQPVASTMTAKYFRVTNTGTTPLTITSANLIGGNAGDFYLTALGDITLPSGSSTDFPVWFNPTAEGERSTTLRVISDDSNENPFDITLTGTGLSYTADTDGDGMNDAAESLLTTLGFDWQVNQAALVNTYYTYANAANLYSQAQYDANRTAGRNDVTASPNTYNLYDLSQVQALNIDVPLLMKDPVTGRFKLTMGVQKSNNLTSPFADFPMNGVGATTTINAGGKLEFEFASPDNAAFFRLESN